MHHLSYNKLIKQTIYFVFAYFSLQTLSAQNLVLNDSTIRNKFYSHDVVMHEALARDSRLAFDNALVSRKAFLDSLFEDATLAQKYSHERIRQQLLTSHIILQYNNSTASSQSTTAAVKLSEELIKDSSIPTDSNIVALYTEAFALMAIQYVDNNKLDSANFYYNKANTQFKRIPGKKTILINALNAVLLYTQGRIAYARKQYMPAATYLKEAIVLLEEYPKFSNAVWFLNLHRDRFYNLRAQALYQAKQPIDSILLPLQVALINISYDEESRIQHLEKLRSKQHRVVDFSLQFDSIAHKVLGAYIINQQLELLHQWLLGQPAKVQNEYGALGFRLAVLLDGLIGYTNSQFHHNYSHEALMKLYYQAYERNIDIAYICFEQKQESMYLQYAAHWMEKVRYFLAQSTLYSENLSNFSGVDPTLLDTYNQTEERLNYLEYLSLNFTGESRQVYQDLLVDERQTLEKIDSLFREKFPKYHAFRHPDYLPTLAELSKTLDSTSIILQFFEGPNFVFMLTISNDAIALKRYDKSEYISAIKGIIKDCIEPNFKTKEAIAVKTFGYQAFNFYKKYIADKLKNNTKKIIFIPDGISQYLPLGALCFNIPTEGMTKFTQLPYLIKEYAISYNISTSFWYNSKQSPKEPINTQVLGLAADYTNNNEILPLVNNSKTLDSLDNLFRGDFYWGTDATVETFKRYAPYYGFLHLGVRSKKKVPAISSSFIFSSADSSLSEEISLWDIQNLDLQAAMTVLSSFPSGYSQYGYGEDRLALYTTLLYAGSNSLVVPLWETAQPNAPVVLKFYHLLEESFEKDQALQIANLDYLDEEKNKEVYQGHPFYWASFIQVGDTIAIEPSERITIWWYLIPLIAIVLIGMWARNGLKQKRRF